MKLFILNLFTLLNFGCSQVETKPNFENRINDDLTFQSLDENTFVVTDNGLFSSNILVAKMPDDTVVIASSPANTFAASIMVNWIQEKLKPKKIVVPGHGNVGGIDLITGTIQLASIARKKLHLK